jgi:hypothetical protein
MYEAGQGRIASMLNAVQGTANKKARVGISDKFPLK